MNQAPWWATPLAGFGGIILGQMLSWRQAASERAFRESQRWDGERLKAFALIQPAVDAYVRAAAELGTESMSGSQDAAMELDRIEPLAKARAELDSVLAMVDLLGTSAMLEVTADLREQGLKTFALALRLRHAALGGEVVSKPSEELANAVVATAVIAGRLRDACRQSMGLEKVTTVSPWWRPDSRWLRRVAPARRTDRRGAALSAKSGASRARPEPPRR